MHHLPSTVVKDAPILTRQQVGSIYIYDLPFLTYIDSELDLWKQKWKSDKEVASELRPEHTLSMTFPQYSYSFEYNGHSTSYKLRV